MPDARLTHPTRPTLALEQRQQSVESTEATGNVTAELGVDRTPLVHTETRDVSRDVRALVTGAERAEQDPDTDDWEQSLSNYVQALEARVDEFQGEGYTLEDDLRDIQVPVVLDSIEWTLRGGRPFEIEYSGTVQTGRGVLDSGPLNTDDATVNTGMNVAATVDGLDLPNLRQMVVEKSIEVEPQAIFDRDSAENNQIVADSGASRVIRFDGTHTGTFAQRATAEQDLKALVGTDIVTLQTRFPGYAVDGKVMGYESDFQASFGEQSHEYSLRFVEGREA